MYSDGPSDPDVVPSWSSLPNRREDTDLREASAGKIRVQSHTANPEEGSKNSSRMGSIENLKVSP